jgi:hypothetical protein
MQAPSNIVISNFSEPRKRRSLTRFEYRGPKLAVESGNIDFLLY